MLFDRSLPAKFDAIYRSQAIAEFNLGGVVLSANKKFLDALGYTLADIKGRKSHKIVADGLQVLRNLDHRGAVGAVGQEHRHELGGLAPGAGCLEADGATQPGAIGMVQCGAVIGDGVDLVVGGAEFREQQFDRGEFAGHGRRPGVSSRGLRTR